MTTPMLPLLCPVMIGREDAFATWMPMLDRLRFGQGHTVGIAGEAGIGKSRFITEARARAAQVGIAMLTGHCFEQDRHYPYAPWIDLGRAFITEHGLDALAGLIGPEGAALVALLPELAPYYPPGQPSSLADPDQAKRPIMHALRHLLVRLASDRPWLIAIEDLHWCDENSLECLAYLTRQITRVPIMILVTYRDDEVALPLEQFLANLARQRLGTEIILRRLTAPEFDQMFRAIFALHSPIDAATLHRLFALTEGNPLFVEEIVNVLYRAGSLQVAEGRLIGADSGKISLPRTIRETVRRRLERLDPAAHTALTIAAMTGRRFDFALLLTLTNLDERQLIGHIKEMIAAQLVKEVSPDQFEFRHALIQEAIGAELLARERMAYHQAIADAIEARQADGPEDQTAALAFHYAEGGNWARAAIYARHAGAHALALFAPRAAVEQFTRAITAEQHLDQPPDPTLRLQRGRALEQMGAFDEARADFETALSLAESGSAKVVIWQALTCLGMLWAGRDYLRTGEYYQQALTLARQLGEPTVIARSLNALGNWHINQDEAVAALTLHHEALQVVCLLDDALLIAETEDYLGLASLFGNAVHEAEAYYRAAIPRFRALGDRLHLTSCLTMSGINGNLYQTDTLIATITLPESQTRFREALAIARSNAMPAAESFALFNLASGYGEAGEYGQAIQAVDDGMRIADEIGHQQWRCALLVIRAWIAYDLLDFDQARAEGERAIAVAGRIGSMLWLQQSRAVVAPIAIAQGDYARAESLFAAMPISDATISTSGRSIAASRAELALIGGDALAALIAVERLIAAVQPSGPPHCIPRLALLQAKALAALDRVEDAIAVALTACQAAEHQGIGRMERLLSLLLAELYRRARRYDAEEATVTRAKSLIAAQAATLAEGPIGTHFIQASLRLLPQDRPVTPLRARKRDAAGLTAREREVARLIAQGATNRAIAEALTLGERTIETHVSHILGKLGCTTRSHIAAWVIQHGLTADEDGNTS